MKKNAHRTALLGLALVLGGALATRAHADNASAAGTDSGSLSQPSLEQRVDALEQRLAELSPVTGTGASFQGSRAFSYASPERGVGFTNSDGNYGIQFSGTFQEDSRNYLYDGLDTSKGLTAQPANEFVDARARLLVDAFLGPRLHLRYQEDFSNNGNNSGVTGPGNTTTNGGTGGGALLVDAYGELKLLPWTILRVGQFKAPLDLERWRLTPAEDFIQYSYTAALVVDRDQGALIEIVDPRQILYLSGGAINGDTDAGSSPVVQSYNSNKDAVAKLFVQPFNGIHDKRLGDLGLGVAGTAGNHSGDPTFTYKSLGQQTIVSPLTGNAWTTAYVQGAGYRIVPQAYWFQDSFSVLSEYVNESEGYRTPSQVNDLIAYSEAWQVQVGWILTGEHASYNGWKLDKDSCAWGGLQLVARAQAANYDENAVTRYNSSTSATVASTGLIDPRSSVTGLTSWTLGLNYIPVNDLEFLLDWDQTSFDNGGVNNLVAGGKVVGTVLANRPTEQSLQVRAQFAF